MKFLELWWNEGKLPHAMKMTHVEKLNLHGHYDIHTGYMDNNINQSVSV